MERAPQEFLRAVDKCVWPKPYDGPADTTVDTEEAGEVLIRRTGDTVSVRVRTEAEDAFRHMLGISSEQVDERGETAALNLQFDHETDDGHVWLESNRSQLLEITSRVEERHEGYGLEDWS